ncbi:unnamed protein product [Sphagnum troendelagicum]|uniref:Uncharacterized protein n=2 Tax=Sphagnum TaxID=13804 RepID=A0ABP0V2A5_9BRYO
MAPPSYTDTDEHQAHLLCQASVSKFPLETLFGFCCSQAHLLCQASVSKFPLEILFGFCYSQTHLLCQGFSLKVSFGDPVWVLLALPKILCLDSF